MGAKALDVLKEIFTLEIHDEQDKFEMDQFVNAVSARFQQILLEGNHFESGTARMLSVRYSSIQVQLGIPLSLWTFYCTKVVTSP